MHLVNVPIFKNIQKFENLEKSLSNFSPFSIRISMFFLKIHCMTKKKRIRKAAWQDTTCFHSFLLNYFCVKDRNDNTE